MQQWIDRTSSESNIINHNTFNSPPSNVQQSQETVHTEGIDRLGIIHHQQQQQLQLQQHVANNSAGNLHQARLRYPVSVTSNFAAEVQEKDSYPVNPFLNIPLSEKSENVLLCKNFRPEMQFLKLKTFHF